ncbi:SAM domain containing protein [Gracilaria domingensis]|nr:SAM domain containing protein [Gracilaria domingensis]
MRHYHRPPLTSRRTRRKSSSSWANSIQRAWRSANGNERFAIIVAALAAVAFAGTVVNLVFHISLFLAVAAVSLVAAPLLFLIMLSFTAFTVGVLMTTGFGFLIFGAPMFTVGLMAKMTVPLLAVVGGVSFIASRVLPFGERHESEDTSDPVEYFDEQDEFERFDDTLKTRVSGSSAIDVESWGLNEVVDELDFSGLGEYRQLFIEERIDGHTLLSLTDDDIKAEFGRTMPLGDRIRLIRLVAKLRRRSSRLP